MTAALGFPSDDGCLCGRTARVWVTLPDGDHVAVCWQCHRRQAADSRYLDALAASREAQAKAARRAQDAAAEAHRAVELAAEAARRERAEAQAARRKAQAARRKAQAATARRRPKSPPMTNAEAGRRAMALRRRCGGCELVAAPPSLGMHQKFSGHTGWVAA